MTLWCAPCLGTHEVVRAVTVNNGHAYCVRHFAQSVDNPAMTAEEIQEMVLRALAGHRFDETGQPLPSDST